MYPQYKMREGSKGSCYSVLLLTLPGVPSTDKGKVQIHFLSDDKESIRSQVTERNGDALGERTKDWEWENFGFLPASTPDQM